MLFYRRRTKKDNTDLIKYLKSNLHLVEDQLPTLSVMFEELVGPNAIFGKPKKPHTKVSLVQILKYLLQVSPHMFLGTLDRIYSTAYYNEYMAGSLTNISFVPAAALKNALCFEAILADVVIQIRQHIYQIEFRISNEHMALRFARLESPKRNIVLMFNMNTKLGISEKREKRIFECEEESIYLEKEDANLRINSYIFQSNKSTLKIDIRELQLLNLDVADVRKYKMYNLLPLTLLRYKVKIDTLARNPLITNAEKRDGLRQIKKNFLAQSRRISDQIARLDAEESDLLMIKIGLGELIEYFDNMYFGNMLKESGDLAMAFESEYAQLLAAAREAKLEAAYAMSNMAKIQLDATARINEAATELTTAQIAIEEAKIEATLAKQEARDMKTKLAEAEATGVKKVAKNLLMAKLDLKLIATSTGLPVREIKKLQNQLKI